MFINKSHDGRNNICGIKVALLRKAEGVSQRELADRLSVKVGGCSGSGSTSTKTPSSA